MSSQPVQEIQVGLIRASIWENSTDRRVRYSIVFTKLYKAADRWQDTHKAHVSPIPCRICVRFGHKKQKKHSQLIVVSAYAVTSAGNRT